MTINKRLIRNIRNNKSFYIGSILLCILTVAFIIAASSTGKTMTDGVEKFFCEYKVENAEFITARPIDENEINRLEELYDVQLEEMRYVDIDINNTTLRVFRETEKINLAQIKEGQSFTGKNSVLINNDYARENSMEIGSVLKIGDSDYNINGFYTRPDYIYMMKSLSDLYVNDANFGIALLETENFDKLSNPQVFYSVIYNNKENSYEFRQEIYKNFKMLRYLSNEANTRISHGINQGKAISGMATAFTPILFILNMGFISVTLSRMVKKERRNIGVLSAFGYKKSEILFYYMKYAVITAIIGSLFGLLGGFLLIKPFLSLYCSEFNFPIASQQYNIFSIIIGAFLPLILFSATALLVVFSMVKKPTVELLKGSLKETNKKTSKLFDIKKLKNSTKYGIRTAIRNKGRSIVFIFGIFVASTMILVGIIMNSSCQYLLNNKLDDAIKYQYAYFFRQVQNEYNYGEGQKFLNVSFECEDSDTLISLIGIDFDSNSKYYPMKTEDGEELNSEGVYISRALSELINITEGDKLDFLDPITLKKYSVNIDGIADNRTHKAIYMTLEKANEFMNYEKGSYNGIYSNEKMNIDGKLLTLTQNRNEVRDAFQKLLEPILATVYVLVILGIVLGVIVITIITGMIADENEGNISMLKVLGYKIREISKMVLNINYYMVFLGYVISIPIVIKFCEMTFKTNIQTMSLFVEVKFTLIDFIISLSIVYITYFIAITLSKRKFTRIDMIESLKDNRE